MQSVRPSQTGGKAKKAANFAWIEYLRSLVLGDYCYLLLMYFFATACRRQRARRSDHCHVVDSPDLTIERQHTEMAKQTIGVLV